MTINWYSFITGFCVAVLLVKGVLFLGDSYNNQAKNITQPRFTEFSGLVLKSKKEQALYEAYITGWHQGVAWDRDWIYDDSTRNIWINADWEFRKYYKGISSGK